MLRVSEHDNTFTIEADAGDMIALIAEIADLGLYARHPIARPRPASRVNELLRSWDQLLASSPAVTTVDAIDPVGDTADLECGADDLPLVSTGQGTSQINWPVAQTHRNRDHERDHERDLHAATVGGAV